MTTPTKREAAQQVILNMPLNQDIPLEQLAKETRYGRFKLTNRQMAHYLLEWVKQGKMKRRTRHFTFYGTSFHRSVYRRIE